MAPTENTKTGGETSTDSEQRSRLTRYDQRVEEWLTSLKEGAEQRSPEVLSALSAKAKDVADYLDKLAEKARSLSEASGAVTDTSQWLDEVPAHGDQVQGGPEYRGPDPESDTKGDGDHEDQGT